MNHLFKTSPKSEGGSSALLLVMMIYVVMFAGLLCLVLRVKVEALEFEFGPFDSSYYSRLAVLSPATITNQALQVTPDSVGNFSLKHRSGRVLLNQTFKLWDQDSGKVASFNSSFLINIFRVNNSIPGEGLAFLIAPDLKIPHASHGKFLGLTNSSLDGRSSNHLLAVELDTHRQKFDPDDNHIGLNINSVRSNKTVSLSGYGIQLAPVGTVFHVVWVQYDGGNKVLNVYMAGMKSIESPVPPRPSKPLLSAVVDLRDVVRPRSYFGFSASTGTYFQLNCVLRWNLTVELLPEKGSGKWWKSMKNIALLGIGVLLILTAIAGGIGGAFCFMYRKRKTRSDPNILCALNSLPGTPREFRFRDLKKATNNFDDRNKLGQGGFGVVYKGLFPNENLEIAVKKFSRDGINSKDDFLAELTIINRLRHKHLVRLLGWCYKNGKLLLMYDYMPNGSLDSHLFHESAKLGWKLRYKIISGVASALHYLHDEYDQTVVHRDLKASNILLDSDFNARLGDFGLARALEHEKTSYVGDSSEGVPGTLGYIAPECFHTGKATRESDVYAFGAVLLEVVCGQRPWSKIDGFQFLVDWVWCLHKEGKLLDAVDPRLNGDYVVEEAHRMLLLGLACSHPNPSERPKTHTILQIVSGSAALLPNVPRQKPAFVWPSEMPQLWVEGSIISLDGDTKSK